MAKKHASKGNAGKKETHKFATKEAEDRYISSFKNRQLCYEKCFRLTEEHTMGQEQYVWSVIMLHNWRKFAGEPHPVAIEVVREFYSHFSKSTVDVVHVRGKPVDFSPVAINTFYGLNTSIEGSFDYSEDPTMEEMGEILDELCFPGSKWDGTQRHSMTLKYSVLKLAPKVWLNVLKTKLLPTTHCGTVNRTRAILLYCIMKNLKINVGKIIFGEIKACAKKNKGDLWFPSLITGLCLQSGVVMTSTEVEKAPVILDKEALKYLVSRQAEEVSDEERTETVSASASKRKLSATKKGKEQIGGSNMSDALVAVSVATPEEEESEKEYVASEEDLEIHSSPSDLPPAKKMRTEESKGKQKEGADSAAEEKEEEASSEECDTNDDYHKQINAILQKIATNFIDMIAEHKHLVAQLRKMNKALKAIWSYEKKKDAFLKAQNYPAFPQDILSEDSEEE